MITLRQIEFSHITIPPCIIGAILIGIQLSVHQSNQYRDRLGILWAMGDTDDADDAVVLFVVSLAIFSTSHSSAQVQRINSTEELDLATSAHMLPQAQRRANES